MPEAVHLVLAGAAGLAIGAVFFGGLWWTVRRGMVSRSPARLFLASMVLRMGFAVTGIYWVSDRRWERSLACLAGFIAARMAVKALTRPVPEKPLTPQEPEGRMAEPQEAGHAA